jgi:deoxyribonuclease-2
MGHCFSCCYSNTLTLNNTQTFVNQLSIKLPHGISSIKYLDENKSFIKSGDNINIWIKNLYKKSNWTNWIVYNDQTENLGYNHTTKGHCKGIITWSDSRISWLYHSTPNFPRYFTGNDISELETNEYMYGQIYQYIELEFNKNLLTEILLQLVIMEPNVYIEKYIDTSFNFKDFSKNNHNIKKELIKKIKINENIEHVAKSPNYEIDIYSEYLAKEYSYIWYIETWIRGHHIETISDKIIDINKIHFEDIEYDEKNDHSKWGVSDNDLYWVGDLNRMTSQYKRGGGGFIINNYDISNSLKSMIII